MNQKNSQNSPSINIKLGDQSIEVCLKDPRSQVLSQFAQLSEAAREQLARDSWLVGFSAVSNAYTRAQEAKLEDIGSQLMTDFDEQLEQHLEQQEKSILKTLSHFFDPESGQVTERLQSFLDDKGALASMLRQYVGADNSELASALAKQVGENSPILKKLSSTESDGIIQLLHAKVEEALEANRKEVAAALDPVSEHGAVGRFLTKLRKELEGADEKRQQQLVRALAALDQNDEQSLLSTMIRESRAAHESLRKAVNPQIEGSPMSSVKKTLEEMLSTRLESQEERLEAMHKEQREFYTNVEKAVARIETRRKEEARSTHGGNTFEEEVHAFILSVVPSGLCMVHSTGNSTGVKGYCKKGDTLIEFSEESAYAGCRVIVESKRDKSYGIGDALSELEQAQKNRLAQVGLFVLAKESAPVGFPGFERYGSRIVVVWDRFNPASDGLLHGAIVCAMALAQRKARKADPGDIKALAKFEQDLEMELRRLGTIDGHAVSIRDRADKITDEVRKAKDALNRVIRNGKKTLLALNVELDEEQKEVAHPITFNGYEAPELDDDEFDSLVDEDEAAA